MQRETPEIRGFDVLLLQRATDMRLMLETRHENGSAEEDLDVTEQAAICVARRTPSSVTIQEIFDECNTAHNDLHRNR